jgi:hypothetical protein
MVTFLPLRTRIQNRAQNRGIGICQGTDEVVRSCLHVERGLNVPRSTSSDLVIEGKDSTGGRAITRRDAERPNERLHEWGRNIIQLDDRSLSCKHISTTDHPEIIVRMNGEVTT